MAKEKWGKRGKRDRFGAAAGGGRSDRRFGKPEKTRRAKPFVNARFGKPEKTGRVRAFINARFGRAAKQPKGKAAWGKTEKNPKGLSRDTTPKKRRRGLLAKWLDGQNRRTLRQYYDKLDAQKEQEQLARRLTGSANEAAELVRLATGRPLSPAQYNRIQSYVEERGRRLAEDSNSIMNLFRQAVRIVRRLGGGR